MSLHLNLARVHASSPGSESPVDPITKILDHTGHTSLREQTSKWRWHVQQMMDDSKRSPGGRWCKWTQTDADACIKERAFDEGRGYLDTCTCEVRECGGASEEMETMCCPIVKVAVMKINQIEAGKGTVRVEPADLSLARRILKEWIYNQ